MAMAAASFRPPNPRTLLRLLLCCGADAYTARIPRGPAVRPSSRRRRWVGAPPSRHAPLAAAAAPQAQALDLDGLADGVGRRDDGADFRLLIRKAARTLVKSDTDGEELDHSYGSASQGLWLHAPAARDMQGVLDDMALKVRAANDRFVGPRSLRILGGPRSSGMVVR